MVNSNLRNNISTNRMLAFKLGWIYGNSPSHIHASMPLCSLWRNPHPQYIGKWQHHEKWKSSSLTTIFSLLHDGHFLIKYKEMSMSISAGRNGHGHEKMPYGKKVPLPCQFHTLANSINHESAQCSNRKITFFPMAIFYLLFWQRRRGMPYAHAYCQHVVGPMWPQSKSHSVHSPIPKW
jgi:hypothetical protein